MLPPMLAPKFDKRVALYLRESLRSVVALIRCVVEIQHDPYGGLVIDWPKSHEKILRTGLDETSP
jgi:hypothetical protein